MLNPWLATGPDTMPRGLRTKLQWLQLFHEFSRKGKQSRSRAEWLAIPPKERWVILLKHLYPVEQFAEELYRNTPFMSFLPRREGLVA